MSPTAFFVVSLLAAVTVEIWLFGGVSGSSMDGADGIFGTGREKRGPRAKRSSGTPQPFTEAERIDGVAIHNTYRSQEGASNMKYMEWHTELARMAQGYAEECLYEHSSMVNKGCYNITYDNVGENLHFNTAKVSLESAVTAWYKEKTDYDFNTVTCAEKKVCGHYTQVVWAKSGLIGCGRAFCPELKENNGNVEKNAYFTSCNYGVKGNYNKAKPYIKGNSCTSCDANMKSCKDNMCYQEGLDYQRPAKKLQDCFNQGDNGGGSRGDNGGDNGSATIYFTILPGYFFLTLLLVIFFEG